MPTDFSLKLVLRNCSSSPRTLLCVLLQDNQLNLISAFFNTWKEPFTEFFRKHRLRFFQLPQLNLGKQWETRDSNTVVHRWVWWFGSSLKLCQKWLTFSVKAGCTCMRSLQPPAVVLSPKPQTGTFAALLGSILKPGIEPDPEHSFLFVVQVCCCVIQLFQLPLYF